MQTNNRNGARHQRLGKALSGLAALFLLFDSTGKLLQVQPVIDGTLSLGYPRDLVFTLGVILLACVLGVHHSADGGAGRAAVDGLPRRRGCDTGARGGAALHARPVSHLRRRDPLGRAASAGCPSARVPSDPECVMSHVISKDGTTITYERSGNGPALILIDGALCSRGIRPDCRSSARCWRRTSRSTVYDRRGRGESGDTPPYCPAARGGGPGRAHRRTRAGRRRCSGCRPAAHWRLKPRRAGLGDRQGDRATSRRTWTRTARACRCRGDGEPNARSAAAAARRRAAIAAARLSYFMRDMVGAPACRRGDDATDAVGLAQAEGRGPHAARTTRR